MTRAEMRRAADALMRLENHPTGHHDPFSYAAHKFGVDESELDGRSPRWKRLKEPGLDCMFREEASMLLTEAERWDINGLP